MSLSGALGLAQSALANNAAQSAILSKNIANVGDADFGRRSAGTVAQLTGSVTQGATQRAADDALLASLLSAQAGSSSQQAISDGLTQIANTLGLDTATTSSTSSATDNSPATAIGALSTALQQYAAQPDNAALATAAVGAAKTLAGNLNQASAAVQAVRTQADSDIAASVDTVNSLLAQFKVANDQVVAGTAAGTDVTDAQDTRDGLLKNLSQEIGITTVKGRNNSLSLYTDSGATLFETTPRTVAFSRTASLAAGIAGQAVTVDGVPVTGASAVMAIKSGGIAGLAALRDTTSVSYQDQLDQIASGLVSAFAESDQTGGGAPPLPGLFTTAGATGLPASASGLAASITVAASVDPSAGGLATRLRDGNIASSSAAYTYNATGASAYSERLDTLTAALSQTRSFDSTSGGAASASLATYAASSVSWLEATRKSASDAADSKSAALSATTTALSNATGVNLDDEMSKMLEVEHAYQASAELMNTVKSMYAALIQSFQ